MMVETVLFTLRAILRVLATVLVTLVMLPLSFESFIGPYPGRIRRRLRWSRWWFCVLLRIWRVRVDIRGAPPPFERPGIILANHLSYLDIIILFAQRPLVFVAKAEIRRWPVIGWLTRYGHAVFIERRPHALPRQIEILRQRMAAGFWVCFFPEGRIGSYQEVQRFRRGFFPLIQQMGRPIYPVVLAYPDRSLVWDQPVFMITHILRWLGRPHVDAVCTWLPAVSAEEVKDRELRELIADLHDRMATAYRSLRTSLEPAGTGVAPAPMEQSQMGPGLGPGPQA